MDHVVHDRRGHGDDALEEEGADDDIGDSGLVDGRAADEDGRHGGQRHVKRGHVELDKAKALLIDQDADGGKPGGEDDGQHAHLVHIHAGGPCEGGVGAHGGHGGAGLGVQEGPHAEGQDREEQQRSRRDGEVSDVDLQKARQHLVIKALEGDGGTQALAREAPDHGGAVVRKQQPHHAHEGHGGKAHIGGDHHFAALDLVEKPAVERAEDDRKGRGDEDGHEKTHGPGEAELDGERRPEKARDDAEGQAEVEAAAGVDHRHHREHHDGVPAEAVDGVADLRPEVRAHKGGRDEQQQQEARDDQSRQAEAFRKLAQAVGQRLIGSV